MPASVDSLDTISSRSSDYYDEEEERLAEEEWQESLLQLQQLLSIVLLPYLGKWLGRRWSHWGTRQATMFVCCRSADTLYTKAYARYVRLGLGKPFFLGERPMTTSRRQ